MTRLTHEQVAPIILQGLKAIRKRRLDPSGGICWNLDLWQERQKEYGELPPVSVRISYWAERWPKFSGVSSYPVPSLDPQLSPAHAFNTATNKRGRMWGKKNPYGALRWELLEFLIATLEAYLAEPESTQTEARDAGIYQRIARLGSSRAAD